MAHKTPLFGACFGHQAIAMALGGHVARNPGGWVFGTTETTVTTPAPWMPPGPIRQYAAHIEQVVDLPDGAKVTMGNADCPVGGYVIGKHVFTTQYHPEMTHDFIGALIEELAVQNPAEVINTARASLAQTADSAAGSWNSLEAPNLFHLSKRILAEGKKSERSDSPSGLLPTSPPADPSP